MEDEGARASSESGFNRSLAPLAIHLAALGAPRPAYKPYSPARFEDQARVLLDAKVPVFSFIFGIPPKEIERIKLEDGIRLHENVKVELDTYARESGRSCR